MLSISSLLFIRFSNAFAFPNPVRPSINIPYEWSGVSDHFGLFSYMSSFGT